jgi:hypothetical protein
MRDPCLIQGPDGLFHMVWTTAWNREGVGYAHSADLVSWSEQRLLNVMAAEPEARNVWAPELFHDAASGRYVILWSSTIPGRFPETEAAGDDGYNHRMYATTTADFETFSPTRLFFDPGHNVIDGTLAGDGERALLFYKDETRNPPAKNLWLAIGARAEGPFGRPIGPITGSYWAEGPTAIRIGGRWFVYFDRYTESRYGLVTSADLEHWTDESDRLTFPRDHRHGTVLRVPRAIVAGLEAAAR